MGSCDHRIGPFISHLGKGLLFPLLWTEWPAPLDNHCIACHRWLHFNHAGAIYLPTQRSVYKYICINTHTCAHTETYHRGDNDIPVKNFTVR